MGVTVVTKGFIEVWRGDQRVSQHTVETKAIESALAHAEEAGDGEYELRFPRKVLSRITRTVIPFIWQSQPALSFTQGTPKTVQLRGTYLFDPQSRVKTITVATGALPTGCAINGTSIVYDGTGAAATSSFTLTASDGTYSQTSSSGSATIEATTSNSPPAWTVPEEYQLPPFTTAGGTIDLSQYAFDAEGDPMVFSRTGGTAPGGMTVSESGVLTVPAGLTVGDYDILVNVTDEMPELVVSVTGAWTAGQSFKKGAAPLGYVTAASTGGSVQAEVRNWWDDGSVKFAVVSGVNPGTVTFTNSTSTQMVGSVAEPALGTCSVSFGALGTATLSRTPSNWNRNAAHRIRAITGPVMSEFHYYAPVLLNDVPHPRLTVRWFVRAYVNGSTEVDTWVESGFGQTTTSWNVSDSYAATVTVNDSALPPTATLTHNAFQRWSRCDWIGTAPSGHAAQDHVYLKATKVVPNIIEGTPDEATWSVGGTSYNTVGLTKTFAESLTPTPLNRGPWRTAMGTGGEGDADQIGVITHHDAVYLCCGDERAINGTIGAARQLGYYAAAWRDETTGLPMLLIDNNSVRVTLMGPQWELEREHTPSWGYVAYLISGRWPFMEGQVLVPCVQMLSVQSITGWPDSLSEQGRSGTKGLINGIERSIWWGMRSLGQGIMVCPENHEDYAAIQAELIRIFDNNLVAKWSVQDPTHPYSITNNLGVLYPADNYPNYTDDCILSSDPKYTTTAVYAPWQKGYGAWVLLHLHEAEVPTNQQATFDNVANFVAKIPAGMLGLASEGGFSWKRAPCYAMAYGTKTNPANWYASTIFSTWGELYDFNMGINVLGTPPAELENDGTSNYLGQWYSNASGIGGASGNYYFWSEAYTNNNTEKVFTNVGMIAMAVDLGTPGAADGWTRFTSAGWYTSRVASNALATYPRYVVVPR